MIYGAVAAEYYAKGVPIIPLYTGEKRPIPQDWSRFHDQPVEESQWQDWVGRYPDANIGVVLGKQSGMCVLDIDTEDMGLAAMLTSLVPHSPWRRVGAKGAVLAFRYSGIRTFRIKNSAGEMICELLSDRTQVVLPPSIHPTTKRAYTANVELLDVIDQLPMLDSQIEGILRGALKAAGVELSLSGSSRVTDFVSAGARDTSMTERAGLFAYAVMRGERTLKEAIGMLRSVGTEFVETVAGDQVDIEKHVSNLIKFIHRDVTDKGKKLPQGWDADLSGQEMKDLGLDFGEEDLQWDFNRLRDHLREQFEKFPDDSNGRSEAVEYVLARMAHSDALSLIDENRMLDYISHTSGLNVRVTILRRRLAELRQTGITGGDHNEIAQAVLDDLQLTNLVRRHNSSLWIYKGSHWQPLQMEMVMAKIAQEYGHMDAGKRHGDHKGIMATIINIAEGGLRRIDKHGVNFANGFLDDDLVLKPHDPDYGCTYTLPFRYLKEQAGQSPNFFQFLQDCWGLDTDYQQKVDALQEALCVTLFGMGPKFQRAILLRGVAKSGKSQLLKIAASLVPDEARCFVPPNDWADKFLPAQMNEKLINICGELSERKKIDGQSFKDIIDGSEMSGQFKGQQIFKFRPKCTHWFASNFSPKTDDTSDGFNRRWLTLEFTRPVAPEKRRIDIGDTIVIEEREAIVAWAVQALERLALNSEYTLPNSHKQTMLEVAHGNNSVRFFLETAPNVRLKQSYGAVITEMMLYKEYWAFCCGPGAARPVSSRVFRQLMRDLQADLNFMLEISTNPMGTQEAVYRCITLAGNSAKR